MSCARLVESKQTLQFQLRLCVFATVLHHPAAASSGRDMRLAALPVFGRQHARCHAAGAAAGRSGHGRPRQADPPGPHTSSGATGNLEGAAGRILLLYHVVAACAVACTAALLTVVDLPFHSANSNCPAACPSCVPGAHPVRGAAAAAGPAGGCDRSAHAAVRGPQGEPR